MTHFLLLQLSQFLADTQYIYETFSTTEYILLTRIQHSQKTDICAKQNLIEAKKLGGLLRFFCFPSVLYLSFKEIKI